MIPARGCGKSGHPSLPSEIRKPVQYIINVLLLLLILNFAATVTFTLHKMGMESGAPCSQSQILQSLKVPSEEAEEASSRPTADVPEFLGGIDVEFDAAPCLVEGAPQTNGVPSLVFVNM